jgi:hypothetical protein
MLTEKQIREFQALLSNLKKRARHGGSGLLKRLSSGEAAALADVVSNLLRGKIPGINIKKIETYRNTLRAINANKRSKKLVKKIAGQHAVQLQRALLYLRPFLRGILGLPVKSKSENKKRNVVRQMWTTPQVTKGATPVPSVASTSFASSPPVSSPGAQFSPFSSRRSSPLSPKSPRKSPSPLKIPAAIRRRLMMTPDTSMNTPRKLANVTGAGSPGGPPAGTKKIIPVRTALTTKSPPITTKGKTPSFVPAAVARAMVKRMVKKNSSKKKSPSSTKSPRRTSLMPVKIQSLN